MKDTLTRAVEQAIKGGFKLTILFPKKVRDNINIFGWATVDDKLVISSYHLKDRVYKSYSFSLSDLIFNHEFMKAVLNGDINHMFGVLLHMVTLPTPTERQDYLESILEVDDE